VTGERGFKRSITPCLEGVHEATPELRIVGRHLGCGLAGAVKPAQPSVIVLGGYLRSLFPLVGGPSQQAML
jgi:hypothetical protein